MTRRHWQASYGSIPKDIDTQPCPSVVDMMDQAMQRFADKPAFRCAGQTLSYADVDRLSRDFDKFIDTVKRAKPSIFIGVNTLYAGLVAHPKAKDIDWSSLRLTGGGSDWQLPEANKAPFTDDGYFRTGDVGVCYDKGLLKIADRKKDMIIVTGFNVYPKKIEAVATGCPGVTECACIGVPDEKSGEAAKLFVIEAAGTQITEAEVIAFCRKELTDYKMPRQAKFVEALPKPTVGQILRCELRDLI